MRAKPSQRTAIFLLIGFVALVYVINLVIFTLTAEAQLIAGGLFMIALGGLWLYLMGGAETLTCDRDTCRIIKPRFLLRAKSVDEVPLTSIEKVEVEEVHQISHDGPGRPGYQVVLRLMDNSSRYFSVEVFQQKAQAIANQVREHLETPGQQSLVVRRGQWIMTCIGMGAIGVGVLLILSVGIELL